MKTKPGEEGMFKFLLMQNGNYLISVVKYPGLFINMQNKIMGWIKGATTADMNANGLSTEQLEWSVKTEF
jgi:hypothetical protein